MKKYKRYLPIFLALIGVVAITVLLFFALLRSPSQQKIEPPKDTVTNTQQTIPENTNNQSSGTPDFADSHNVIDECIAFKKADAISPETSFQKGSMLVTFQKRTNYSEALNLVIANKLKLQSSSEAKTSFENGHWFAVNVPKGEEYQWICVMESSDLVVRAMREPVFDLHQ